MAKKSCSDVEHGIDSIGRQLAMSDPVENDFAGRRLSPLNGVRFRIPRRTLNSGTSAIQRDEFGDSSRRGRFQRVIRHKGGPGHAGGAARAVSRQPRAFSLPANSFGIHIRSCV